ncbi:hypothetical protein P9112_012238, partial [Eukaryota sp. TZLM1-RC]
MRSASKLGISSLFCLTQVLLGESSVGKSSLVARFVSGAFSNDEPPTIGAAFYRCNLELDDKTVEFDTAGQEQYSCLTPVYYRDADSALVVYDITKYDSFERAKRWVRELRSEVSDDVVVCVVGNKLDLEKSRTVPCHDGLAFAEENNCLFKEVSALKGENVLEAFRAIGDALPEKPPVVDVLSPNLELLPPEKSCSC